MIIFFCRLTELGKVLRVYLEDFNDSSSKEMSLVFFQDAVEHISRLLHCFLFSRSCFIRTIKGNYTSTSMRRRSVGVDMVLAFG